MSNEEEESPPPIGHQELRVEVTWAMRRRIQHPPTLIGHQEFRVEVTWVMRRRTQHPPTPVVIRNCELKWHEQLGGVPAYWDPVVRLVLYHRWLCYCLHSWIFYSQILSMGSGPMDLFIRFIPGFWKMSEDRFFTRCVISSLSGEICVQLYEEEINLDYLWGTSFY